MAQLTTAGQLLVNETLPEDLRDHQRVLDKKGLSELLRLVAVRYPERYREISHGLATIGREVSQETGGNSFGLRHLLPARAALETRARLDGVIRKTLADRNLTPKARDEALVSAALAEQKHQQDKIYDESLAERNPLAVQVLSGSRGNKANLASLRGSDLIYVDHRERPIPMPILRSYSEGLTPAEYWASAYGARKGIFDVKFATQSSGYLSKILNQSAHRMMVVGLDDDREPETVRGLPVETDDPDNVGALLAADAGPYRRNERMTGDKLAHLARLGHDRILVRSVTVGGAPGMGIYARDAGVREHGALPGRGDQVGLTAAQALSEPLSQAMLGSKHSGGVAGQGVGTGGFESIDQLVQIPSTFKGGAAHATVDGTVGRIEEAPAGGTHVTVDGVRHYVAPGYALKVQTGDGVEAGDVLSAGVPNPSVITEHKGIGEGRRYFVNTFRKTMRDAGLKAHRRNVEVLAKALVNHVRLTDEVGDYAPEDVVPYSDLEREYRPRDGTRTVEPAGAVGSYLERPYLHYSIGTRVKPSVARELKHFGVARVDVHNEPPPFKPEMVRGMTNLQHDPDWLTRMYGSGLKKSLLGAAHRGGTSDESGTSFVPGLARAVDFGRNGLIRTPEPGYKVAGDGTRPAVPPSPKPPGAAMKAPPVAPNPYAWGGSKGLGTLLGGGKTYGAAGYDAHGGYDFSGLRTPTHAPAPAPPSAPVTPSGPAAEMSAVKTAPSVLETARDAAVGGGVRVAANRAAGYGWRRFGLPAANKVLTARGLPPLGAAAASGSAAGAGAALAGAASRGLGVSTALDAAANAPEAAKVVASLRSPGAFAAQSGRTLARQNAYAADLANQNALARTIQGATQPVSTIAGAASQVPDVIQANSDLGQEAARGGRLDAALDARRLGRIAGIKSRIEAGQAVGAGDRADYEAWRRSAWSPPESYWGSPF